MNENPQNEINDASVTVINHFIGQKNVVDQVKVALEASWNDGIRLPHMLMIGPPGVGKSELAHVLGKEMGSEAFEQLGVLHKYHSEDKGVREQEFYGRFTLKHPIKPMEEFHPSPLRSEKIKNSVKWPEKTTFCG